MNGSLTGDFDRTGRAGKIIGIGKGREPGASRAISPDRSSRDRNWGSKGNSNFNGGLRFSNISNRCGSGKDSLRSSRNNLRRKFGNHKNKSVNLRFSSQDNNVRRKFSSRKDRSKDVRFGNHKALSLEENPKEGRKKNRIETRMTKVHPTIWN
jgi:hypothetical protein